MRRALGEIDAIAQALFEQLPIVETHELSKSAQSTEIETALPVTFPGGPIGPLLGGFYHQAEYGSRIPLGVFIEELNAFADDPLEDHELWLVGGAIRRMWHEGVAQSQKLNVVVPGRIPSNTFTIAVPGLPEELGGLDAEG